MSDNTKIEWADATLNYVNGCSVVSPGCTNCYAMKLAGTRLKHHPSRAGLTAPSKAGPVWTGEVRANDAALMQALRWKRPRRIFWNAHGDLFHEAVPEQWIDRLFAVAALTPQHTHMILTKRSARMREYMTRAGVSGNAKSYPSHPILAAMDSISRAKWPDLQWPLPNVWLGVSVEDQARADERIPDLLATPAAVRFLSCEPLLGAVDLERIAPTDFVTLAALIDAALASIDDEADDHGPRIDWVIAGGESGPGARPMHRDWTRSLRDQCAAAGVPFLFKQWGEWLPWGEKDASGSINFDCRGRRPLRWRDQGGPIISYVGKNRAGRLLDGVEHNAFPEAGE